MPNPILAVAIALGLPASYALNRIFTARAYERRTGRQFSRRRSLMVAVGLWVDGLILVTSLIAFSTRWVYVVIPWIAFNYVAALTFAAARTRRERKLG